MFDAELKYLNVCKGRKVYVWAEERTSSNGHHLLLSSVLILSPSPLVPSFRVSLAQMLLRRPATSYLLMTTLPPL